MPHYMFIIKALSPRDGGWVRFLPDSNFKSEEIAWEAIQIFWHMMVVAGDYVTVDVVRTIAF